MPTLTRENAKQHCRTCLTKLCCTREVGDTGGNGDGNIMDNKDLQPHPSPDETQEEYKEIFINISTNLELQQLLAKYVEEGGVDVAQFPQNICLLCYNKLQSFEKFRRRAQQSTEKLLAVLGANSGVTKVEIDFDEVQQDGDATAAMSHDQQEDIYKMLLKDTLMETESVLLESTAVATLATVEMHDDPEDPFDTTASSKIFHEDGDFSGNDGAYDWQKGLSNDSSTTNESSEEESEVKPLNIKRRVCERMQNDWHAAEDEDGDTMEEKPEPTTTRLRSRKRAEAEAARKEFRAVTASLSSESAAAADGMEKKKRRTKKEMEEWRRSQTEKLESKIKRRNKGTKNTFKCLQCNHCFAHKLTLDAHIRKVHEGSKRPFECDRCDKAYTFIGGLYTHIKEIHETEVRSYSCDQPGCDRIYTSFIAMQKHKRLKHSDGNYQKKYVCEQCGATFNQSGNLKYHRRTKHPTEAELSEREKSKERFECTVCKKLFHSRYTLKYHTLQLHSDDMKYECNVCGRRMAKKFMLVQHMLVHSTDKMPCEHCGKQFIRKFELEAHIRAVHMKLKPFECQYCAESFASRKTLRHHEYIHTGEKPYVCDLCGQSYRQQTCLKNHRKSHEKLSTEALLAANLNRTLANNYIGPTPSQQQLPPCETSSATGTSAIPRGVVATAGTVSATGGACLAPLGNLSENPPVPAASHLSTVYK